MSAKKGKLGQFILFKTERKHEPVISPTWSCRLRFLRRAAGRSRH